MLTFPPLATILLVDDDNTANYLHKLLLTTTMQVAAQVLVAENGQEALATLAQTCTAATVSCPQLILLDLNMPVMNGCEFLEAYVRLPEAQRQASVVVVLTTSGHEQDHLLVRQFPIADFLHKPLTRAKVAGLLARHFAQVDHPDCPASTAGG